SLTCTSTIRALAGATIATRRARRSSSAMRWSPGARARLVHRVSRRRLLAELLPLGLAHHALLPAGVTARAGLQGRAQRAEHLRAVLLLGCSADAICRPVKAERLLREARRRRPHVLAQPSVALRVADAPRRLLDPSEVVRGERAHDLLYRHEV